MVKEAKSAYYNTKLNIHNYDKNKGSQGSNGSKKMWSMVKKLSGKLSIQPPRKLVVEGKVITLVKTISNLINKFFVNKICKIRNNFGYHKNTAIDILKLLIPKPKSKFQLKPPAVSRVSQIIKKFKNSNSSGFDNISIKVFKN